MTRSVRRHAGWFEALRDVVDEAERLALSGGALLAPSGPPVIVAVRQ